MSWTTRTLDVGGASKEQLLKRLAERSIQLNKYARQLFANPTFKTSTDPRQVRLKRVSLPQLGLHEGGLFAEVLHRASLRGLEPCSLELGPHLRLDVLDQPRGPYLTLASVYPGPINMGFYLRHLDDGLWLRGFTATPDHVYKPTFTDFVFVEPLQ